MPRASGVTGPGESRDGAASSRLRGVGRQVRVASGGQAVPLHRGQSVTELMLNALPVPAKSIERAGDRDAFLFMQIQCVLAGAAS